MFFLYPCPSTNQYNKSGVYESASGTFWKEFKIKMKLVSYYKSCSQCPTLSSLIKACINITKCLTSYVSWLITGRVCVCLDLAKAQFLY